MPSSRAASASAPGPMKAAASTPPASESSTPAASAASIPGSTAATSSPPLGMGHPCPAFPPRPPPEDRGCERLLLLYRKRFPVVFGGHEDHDLLTIRPQVHQTTTIRSLCAKRMCLPQAGHLGEQVDRANEVARSVEQRRRIGLEVDVPAIRPFGHSAGSTNGSPFPNCDRHWTLIVREVDPLLRVELPSYAPAILANARPPPRKRYACFIVMSDHTLRA